MQHGTEQHGGDGRARLHHSWRPQAQQPSVCPRSLSLATSSADPAAYLGHGVLVQLEHHAGRCVETGEGVAFLTQWQPQVAPRGRQAGRQHHHTRQLDQEGSRGARAWFVQARRSHATGHREEGVRVAERGQCCPTLRSAALASMARQRVATAAAVAHVRGVAPVRTCWCTPDLDVEEHLRVGKERGTPAERHLAKLDCLDSDSQGSARRCAEWRRTPKKITDHPHQITLPVQLASARAHVAIVRGVRRCRACANGGRFYCQNLPS